MSTSTSKPLKPKRGTTAQNNGYTGEAYEVTLDTDKKTLVCHDGLTAGGFPLAKEEEVSALDGTLRGLIEAEKSVLQGQIQNAVPAGTVIAWAANSTPNGYLLCNGAAVSRTTYAALFSAIGTTYGTGDGSSTFNLPNLTDRFIQGSGTAGTVKAAGLPEIEGSTENAFLTGGGAEARKGLLIEEYESSPARIQWENGGSYRLRHWGIKASNYNSYYGASNTVQPPAVTMRYHIKY